MARNKHASSRNRCKMGDLATKLRGRQGRNLRDAKFSRAELAFFRLNEGSNKTNRKEIRPDENSRQDGRPGSNKQTPVPHCGPARLQGAAKPLRAPEDTGIPPSGRLGGGRISPLAPSRADHASRSCQRTRQERFLEHIKVLCTQMQGWPRQLVVGVPRPTFGRGTGGG